MSGFSTRIVLLDVSGQPYRLRVFAGLQPFDARAPCIPFAQWRLFGPTRLAGATCGSEAAGERILEPGRGIGPASAVLQCRGAGAVRPRTRHHLRKAA